MTTQITRNLEAIKDYLENLSDGELIATHRIYCENNGYHDDEIFDNEDEFFNTNYTIIHRLHSLGFITKEECATLAQQTPTVF